MISLEILIFIKLSVIIFSYCFTLYQFIYLNKNINDFEIFFTNFLHSLNFLNQNYLINKNAVIMNYQSTTYKINRE